MEGLVAIFQTPGGALALELIGIAGIVWIFTEQRRSKTSLHTRIDKMMEKFNDHEKICAERWGEVKTKLKSQE